MKKNILFITLFSLFMFIPTLSAAEIDIDSISNADKQEYTKWNSEKGLHYDKGDIIYTNNGEKFLVLKDFTNSGKNTELTNEDLTATLVEYGDEVNTPAKTRMETCTGDTWHTVKTGVSKTNITNKFFGNVKRKTSWYAFSGSKQQSLSTSISGYGVTIKYDLGVSSGGSWGISTNKSKFSTVKNNVKGNIQTKSLSNCSKASRFVETHEWATVHYY